MVKRARKGERNILIDTLRSSLIQRQRISVIITPVIPPLVSCYSGCQEGC